MCRCELIPLLTTQDHIPLEFSGTLIYLLMSPRNTTPVVLEAIFTNGRVALEFLVETMSKA